MSNVSIPQHHAGTKTSIVEEGGLGNLPNPDALKGMQTTKQQLGVGVDQQFSLVTPLASLLPESPQSKSAILVGPVSPPIPANIAEKIWRGEYIELQDLLPARLWALGPTILNALLQPEKMKQK